MKKIIQTIVAVAVVANMTGCATPYMTDRRRDAADIFTCTAGLGVGAKARVGPLQLPPLLANTDAIGLRGGQFFAPTPVDDIERSGGYLEFLIERGSPGMEIAQPIPLYEPKFSCLISGLEGFNIRGVMEERHKDIDVICMGPIAYEYSHPAHWYYYTQIEVCVGLGLNLRLGFNPGELLDFILGWTTIDIFKDDLEAKKQKEEKSNHVREDTSRNRADPQH